MQKNGDFPAVLCVLPLCVSSRDGEDEMERMIKGDYYGTVATRILVRFHACETQILVHNFWDSKF